MDSARQQIVDSIKNNSNILVTVSTNPSVDELSAALGLTILLNNMDKRAAAVFSGTIPPAINFLEPDKTFENSADSLRDFIIALDKEKADHLRYKVEGDVVKIFITPYKTTLTQNDLEFSQGDYNVELVIAVGVKDQDHLDKALTAHGKILHDATVVTVTAGNDTSSLGTIDWHDGAASSLCEMMVSLVDGLKTDKPLLDEQISSAFLTGIVSATDRFSNDRTSSRAMTMAAQLMAAGANQQLIAAKLEEAHDIAPGPVASPVSTKPSKQPEASQSEPEANSSELSISRSDRGPKKAKKQADDTSSKQDSADTVPGEKELEAQLAESVLPTMADIEKELQQAAEPVGDTPPAPAEEAAAEPPADDTAPLTAATDSDMPGFEAPAIASPTTEATQPDLPPLPPLPDLPAPDQPSVPIVDDRGPFTSEPVAADQAINSVSAGLSDDQNTLDPFASPVNPASDMQPESAVTPPSQDVTLSPPVLSDDLQPVGGDTANFGTPEGAAQLGTMPAAPEPAAAPQPDLTIPTLPPLPPLPPLPENGGLPPLPPPPPLPDFGQPLSGAVSGDVFGDSAAAPQSAPAPAAPEPGQFKIPGQG